MEHLCIVSGGQTGVDRAALDVAIDKGLPYSGWCPKGGWAEDFSASPGLLAKYGDLRQTVTAVPEQRTAWNVRDSHATLIVLDGPSLEMSKGTLFTRNCAELVFLRPCHVTNLKSDNALNLAAHWLANLLEAFRVDRFSLNIAGPRESESPGIYKSAFLFFDQLLTEPHVLAYTEKLYSPESVFRLR
ncbi:MAG TPA: putative molybdenum carrier protein [Candidatus Angelobacter sp.]|jgi:hypothetical protein|nr:putative molybdenum carrier protein [Candidatus Angelobacter sp.]